MCANVCLNNDQLLLVCDSRRNTLLHSVVSLTSLAVNLFALPILTVWWCCPSGCHLLPTRLSRSSSSESGTTYQPMRRLLSRYPHYASGWNPISLRSHSPAISWTLLTFLSGLSSSLHYLSHLKTWLIGWLIVFFYLICNIFQIQDFSDLLMGYWTEIHNYAATT